MAYYLQHTDSRKPMELNFYPFRNIIANWNALNNSICKLLVKIEAASNQLERQDQGTIEPINWDHHGLSTQSRWMCLKSHTTHSDALQRWCGAKAQ